MSRQDPVGNIAIVKLSSLGDIVHALPVASTLKKHFKNCRITWITEKAGVQLLGNYPDVDDVIVVDTKGWRKQIRNPLRYPFLITEIIRTIKKLRSVDHVAAVDLQGLLKSGVILRFLRSRERWGFPPHKCRERINARFTNRHISDSLLHGHIIDRNLAFAYLMGAKTPVTKLRFPCPKPEKIIIDEFINSLPRNKKKIIINPGAGWVTKTWPVENHRGLCTYLYEKHDAVSILTWGPGEESLVRSIHEGLESCTVIAPTTSLAQLAYLLTQAVCVIGGDTGPIHLAAAQGVPVVALLGPSDPVRNGPYGNNHAMVYHELECSGCYKRKCRDPKCMGRITVDEVITAFENIFMKTQQD